MKRIIKSDILWEDKDEIAYTDTDLIECINILSSQVKGFNKIMMCFSQRNERWGEVLLYMLLEPHTTSNDMRYLVLHEIDLEEEDWKECVKECQREKRMIKRHFSNIKVTSDFKY